MTEERPNGSEVKVRPLTEEEVERGLQAIKRAEELGKRILARRKCKPLPPSWKLIRQAREDLAGRF